MIIKLIKDIKKIDLEIINKLLYQLDPKSSPLTRNSLKKILTQKNVTIIGCYKNNQPNSLIAVISLVFYQTFSGYRCRIEDFVVEEKERGKGIGTKLLKKAILMAKNKKVAFIELTSRPERKIANALYQKMSFKIKKTNVYRYNFYKKL